MLKARPFTGPAGTGVAQSYEEAARLYSAAVEKGYANAEFNLGLLHEDGLGVEQSAPEALRLYTLAAEQGDAKVRPPSNSFSS